MIAARRDSLPTRATYYLLRNVLVRRGNIVLFVPPAGNGSKPPDSPVDYYFFRPRKGAHVKISYEPTPASGGDPFATACAHAGQGPA